MTTRDDFLHRMRTATEGTPYTVEPTDHGFTNLLLRCSIEWVAGVPKLAARYDSSTLRCWARASAGGVEA